MNVLVERAVAFAVDIAALFTEIFKTLFAYHRRAVFVVYGGVVDDVARLVAHDEIGITANGILVHLRSHSTFPARRVVFERLLGKRNKSLGVFDHQVLFLVYKIP